MRFSHVHNSLSLVFFFVLAAACSNDVAPSATQSVAKATSVTSSWAEFREMFLEEYLAANPTLAIDLGKHEYDGQLPDWTLEGQAVYVAKLDDWMQRAGAIDSTHMSDAEMFEREYLLSDLEEEMFFLRDVNIYNRHPLPWSFAAFPSVYLTREYASLEVRLDAFTTYLENLPEYLSAMRATVTGPMPRTWAETAEQMLGGIDTFFSDAVPQVFVDVENPRAQQRLATAVTGASTALKETVEWLKNKERNEDFALGAELFQRMLWATERVDTPLAELKAIGEADMARNLEAMREACADFAPGLSLIDCAAKSKLDKPAEGPVEGAKRQLDKLKQFVVDNDMVSIPSDDPVTVDASPPYAASNLAYIDIPGPYEKTLPAVYYIAPPNPDWSEGQQHQYLPGETDLLFVSVHEVWPGHFLNFLHAKQADSIYGRVSVGYAFAEGWAHYTEEMMHDAGLGEDDPQVHIGQLTNALLRNARFLSAIGLHTEGMTVEESQRMFIEKGLQDPGNAKQQAYRGTADPLYLNYTMGKLMITKLRDDWVASRGGRDAWKAFHDEFLSYGGPPIPMVREAMLGGAGGSLFATPAAETAAGEAEAL